MPNEPLVYRQGHGLVTKSEAATIDEAAQTSTPRMPLPDFLMQKPQRGSWVMRDGKFTPKSEAAVADSKRGR